MVNGALRKILGVWAVFIAAAAGSLLFPGCADFFAMSAFPSYLPGLEKTVNIRSRIPWEKGSVFSDIWLRAVTSGSGKRFLVMGGNFDNSGVQNGFFLVFSRDLKHRGGPVTSEDVYGAGNVYRIGNAAGPAPGSGSDSILLAFDASPNSLVAYDVASGTVQPYADIFGLGTHWNLNNPGIVNPVTGDAYYFQQSGMTAVEIKAISGMAAHTPYTRDAFATPLGETLEVFLGVAPTPDRSGAVLFFKGFPSGKIFASAPIALSGPLAGGALITTDDTPFPVVGGVQYPENVFAAPGGLVVERDGYWRFLRTTGGRVEGPKKEEWDRYSWTFAPEGDLYYILDRESLQLSSVRTWW